MNKISHDIFCQAMLPVHEALPFTDLSLQPAESVSRWRLQVEGLKSLHVLQISRISDTLINNQPLSEAAGRNEDFAVNGFLNSPDAVALKALLTEKSWHGMQAEENGVSRYDDPMKTEFVFSLLHAANDQIMKVMPELETLWQVRHPGLEEKLGEIRRAYVYWSLQLASMLFVNCISGQIVMDRFEDTPLNAFKSTPLFNQFAASVPALSEAVALAGVHDRKLYDAADELRRLMIFSEWDKAYLLYRDVFPPATNALCARLDQVISLEKRIACAQARCINLFNERIAPASETMMDYLGLLSRMLAEKSGSMAADEAPAGESREGFYPARCSDQDTVL
jgi:hypothetical protein